MNVLNYFNTVASDWAAGCSTYNDRTGDPVTARECNNNGPRGAAESTGALTWRHPDADLERQRTKIVKAINTMDADVVSLEEIENSIALGEADRDDALKSLVDGLNAAAGSTRWAYVPSPPADQPRRWPSRTSSGRHHLQPDARSRPWASRRCSSVTRPRQRERWRRRSSGSVPATPTRSRWS